MSRIISGSLRGQRLDVPKSGTRPTTDRTREAMFSALESDGAILGASVIDVFAGSGALGFEALSRGAGRVTFVESGRPAVTVIKRNAASLGVDAQTTICALRAPRALATVGAGFTLAFLDPPYEIDPAVVTDSLAALVGVLDPHAVVVLEASVRTAPPAWPDALKPHASREYGDTRVYYAERTG